jgi:hypothetical protein
VITLELTRPSLQLRQSGVEIQQLNAEVLQRYLQLFRPQYFVRITHDSRTRSGGSGDWHGRNRNYRRSRHMGLRLRCRNLRSL